MKRTANARARGTGSKRRSRPVSVVSKRSLAPLNRAIGDLALSVAALETDAVKLLAFIAARLVIGRDRYGNLDLKRDGRDWVREAREECADGIVYLAAAAMQERRRTKP